MVLIADDIHPNICGDVFVFVGQIFAVWYFPATKIQQGTPKQMQILVNRYLQRLSHRINKNRILR
jgi:hypothetical protein